MTHKKGHPMNRAHKRRHAASSRTPITILAGIAIVVAGFLGYGWYADENASAINAATLDLTRPVDGLGMLREYNGLDTPVRVTQAPQEAVQLDAYNHSIGIN